MSGRTILALALLCAGSPTGSICAGLPDPPTVAEIRLIEARIDMPGDAHPLDEYFRYYYIEVEQQQRTIKAGYVARSFIDSSELPANPIVIVHGFEDVPLWFDAGCGIVRVSYTPQQSADVEARCDSEIELFPPPAVPGWMYALVPLAPIAAFLYFGITRWFPAYRARRADTSRTTPT